MTSPGTASAADCTKSREKFGISIIPRDHRLLKEGLVLAIEPFLTTGQGRIHELGDGWSLRTADNAIAAQFEHTIIVTKNEPVVLTA